MRFFIIILLKLLHNQLVIAIGIPMPSQDYETPPILKIHTTLEISYDVVWPIRA